MQTAPAPARTAGFTLVELLVSMTVLLIVMAVLFQITANIAGIWKSSSGKTSAFQTARAAFSTLNQTLARATLNTYNDYVSVSTAGAYTFRNSTNASTFFPNQFARASELHFLSGSTTDIATAAGIAGGSSLPGANPGHAVFFQATQGDTNTADDTVLNHALNSFGFYIQYGKLDSNLVPNWLASSAAATRSYRFRLFEFVDPTESLKVYTSTSSASGSYLLDWLSFATLTTGTTTVAAKARPRVLAEDVVLLVLRPRLSPRDEQTVASAAPTASGKLMNSSYNQQTDFGGVLSPNYNYDSRAWQSGYPPSSRVNGGYTNGDFTSASGRRVQLMCNQLPPVCDIAMVCADGQSLARFDQSSSTPPSQLAVGSTLFTDSTKLEADLSTYAAQLSANHVRYHILRSTLEIQSAKWSNN